MAEEQQPEKKGFISTIGAGLKGVVDGVTYPNVMRLIVAKMDKNLIDDFLMKKYDVKIN